MPEFEEVIEGEDIGCSPDHINSMLDWLQETLDSWEIQIALLEKAAEDLVATFPRRKD